MNNHELKSLRKLLFLSVTEASVHVAGHASERGWRRLESGQNSISTAISERMTELSARRIQLIHGGLNLRHYDSFDEYSKDWPQNDFLEWKAQRSAAAHLFSEILTPIKSIRDWRFASKKDIAQRNPDHQK